MTVNRTLVLAFINASPDESNRLADDLKESLRAQGIDATLERHRERDDTQDFGGTLVLILGTTAVTALARGVAVWLQRTSGARLTVKTANGDLIAEGLDSTDVSRIVKAFTHIQ